MFEEALQLSPAVMAQAGLHERQRLLVPCLFCHTSPAHHDGQTNNAVWPARMDIEPGVLQGSPRRWPRLPHDLCGPAAVALAYDNSQRGWPVLINPDLALAQPRGADFWVWLPWPPMAIQWHHRAII